jgi:hypothetical protein
VRALVLLRQRIWRIMPVRKNPHPALSLGIKGEGIKLSNSFTLPTKDFAVFPGYLSCLLWKSNAFGRADAITVAAGLCAGVLFSAFWKRKRRNAGTEAGCFGLRALLRRRRPF